jgi:glycosyltransferase involved in cell wall biosynthesis
MRVLFLTKYGEKAASCRYRFLQYLPYLTAHGVECTVSPLFDDRYLEYKFRSGHARAADVVAAFARRTLAILSSVRFDLVVLHVEAFPYLPPFFERALRLLGTKYVYDYDDAIFHNYDLHKNALVRFLLKDKIAAAIAGATTVIAGNPYLAQYARRVNQNVQIIPTVVDLARYLPAARPADAPFTVGWIGSPSTSEYLKALAAPLKILCSEGECRIRLVGAGGLSLPELPLENIPWSEQAEIAEIQQFDVGIMPLPDEPWACGKCGFKLIQYMGCGIPVVASPVGVNREIVDHGKNGFLAQDGGQWLEALRSLRDDHELRRRMGEAGRHKVEQNYSLQVAAPMLLSVLENSVKSRQGISKNASAA